VLYDLSIQKGHDISCSCPDRQISGNFCKHLMHLLIRVIGMPSDQVCNHFYQHSNFQVRSETIHSCETWFALKESNVRLKEDKAILGSVKQKEIEDDDDCPVCYEAFVETKKEPIIWCRAGCGKSVHKSCFLKWSQSIAKNSNKSVGCVYCRTEWVWTTSSF
jgi:hypothetical protein